MNRVARRLLQLNFNTISRVNQNHLSSSSSSSSQPIFSLSKRIKYSPRRYEQDNLETPQGPQAPQAPDEQSTIEFITGGRDFEELSVDKFSELIESNEDRERIEEILTDYEYIKYETRMVPSTLSITDMKELLSVPRGNREKSFHFMLTKEVRKNQKKVIKENTPKSPSWYSIQKCLDNDMSPQMGCQFDPETGAPIYGEWRNSHFIRIRQQDFRASYNCKMIVSHLFGAKLVIDCDFNYNLIEAKRTASDLHKALCYLKLVPDPFDANICGLKSPALKNFLNKSFTSFDPKNNFLPVNAFEESFTEMFPKEKLVYISQRAREPLREYDADLVYIIAGLPSHYRDQTATGKKCAHHGIRMVSFPMDGIIFRALPFAKNLNIDELVKILSHFSETGDMSGSISHGINPFRLKRPEEIEKERSVRLKKYLSQGMKKYRVNPSEIKAKRVIDL